RRSRHSRCSRDWSSDVCSSDLRFFSYDQDFGIPLGGFKNSSVATNKQHYLFFGMQNGICFFDPKEIPIQLPITPVHIRKFTTFQIGRASCRQPHTVPARVPESP